MSNEPTARMPGIEELIALLTEVDDRPPFVGRLYPLIAESIARMSLNGQQVCVRFLVAINRFLGDPEMTGNAFSFDDLMEPWLRQACPSEAVANAAVATWRQANQ